MARHEILSEKDVVEKITTHAYARDGCLIWAGSLCRSGAPLIKWNRKSWRAQRLLLSLTRPSFNPKWLVVTSCGNRDCVNPNHLMQTTRNKFYSRLTEIGARPSGKDLGLRVAIARSSKARLGIDRAQEVVQLLSEGWTQKRVAEKFGVVETRVTNALKTWRNLGVI